MQKARRIVLRRQQALNDSEGQAALVCGRLPSSVLLGEGGVFFRTPRTDSSGTVADIGRGKSAEALHPLTRERASLGPCVTPRALAAGLRPRHISLTPGCELKGFGLPVARRLWFRVAQGSQGLHPEVGRRGWGCMQLCLCEICGAAPTIRADVRDWVAMSFPETVVSTERHGEAEHAALAQACNRVGAHARRFGSACMELRDAGGPRCCPSPFGPATCGSGAGTPRTRP